MCKKLIR